MLLALLDMYRSIRQRRLKLHLSSLVNGDAPEAGADKARHQTTSIAIVSILSKVTPQPPFPSPEMLTAVTVAAADTSIVQAAVAGRQQKKFIEHQMFIMMLSSIILFMVTILPYSIVRILFFKVSVIDLNSFTTIDQSIQLFAAVTIVIGRNYAFNFYLHCLTSRLFRKECLRMMIYCGGE
jgi:hypothetical protein